MSEDTFAIQKLGGDHDEALLRFSVPVPRQGVADCYLDNDVLTNLAHVLSKFLRHPGAVTTSYVLGTFDESYAGGALQITLIRTAMKLSVTLEIITESSKGLALPEKLTARVTAAGVEQFVTSLRALHAAECGSAQLSLTLS